MNIDEREQNLHWVLTKQERHSTCSKANKLHTLLPITRCIHYQASLDTKSYRQIIYVCTRMSYTMYMCKCITNIPQMSSYIYGNIQKCLHHPRLYYSGRCGHSSQRDPGSSQNESQNPDTEACTLPNSFPSATEGRYMYM